MRRIKGVKLLSVLLVLSFLISLGSVGALAYAGESITTGGTDVTVSLGDVVESSADTGNTGLIVDTSGGGNAEVTAGSVGVSNADFSNGVVVTAFDGDATVNTGTVEAIGDEIALGVRVTADNDSYAAVISEGVDAHTGEDPDTLAIGIDADVSNGGSVYVSGQSLDVTAPNGSASGIEGVAYDADGDALIQTGDVSVAGGSSATGVSLDANDDSLLGAEIFGDVYVHGDEATGLELRSVGSQPVEDGVVHAVVGGDVAVVGETMKTTGVHQLAGNGGETDVTITGSVDVQSDGFVNGVMISVDENGTSTTEVGGDLTAVSFNDPVNGVHVMNNGGEASVTVEGDVHAANPSAGAGNAAAAVAAVVEDGKTEIRVGGNVSADSAEDSDGVFGAVRTDGDLSVEVSGDVYADSLKKAHGVNITDNGGQSDVVVQGEVNVHTEEDNATGVYLDSLAGKDHVQIKDGVVADAGGMTGKGLDISAGVNADVTVEVENGIGVSADTIVEGIEVSGADESKVNVTVDGNVVAMSEAGEGEGIVAESDSDSEAAVGVNGNVVTNCNGVFANNKGGDIDVTVNGDVEAVGHGIMVVEDPAAPESEGVTNITVIGDVTSEHNGLSVVNTAGENMRTDVLIDGTLSAGDMPVYLSEDCMDGLTLTVWKVEPNKDGDIAKAVTGTGSEDDPYRIDVTETSKAFEDSILYIIRLEQPEKGGLLSLDGVQDSHGYDTANEGDTVLLKVELEDGYQIIGAYNGLDDEKLELLQDENGDYYLVVPRGGGVTLSAVLEVVERTLTYDLNGGELDGKTGTFTMLAPHGSSVTIPGAPTREGFRFLFWQGSEYYPGDDYLVQGDHTFTAIWEEILPEAPQLDGTGSGAEEAGTGSGGAAPTPAAKPAPAELPRSPKTGDETDLALWTALLLLCAVGLASCLLGKKPVEAAMTGTGKAAVRDRKIDGGRWIARRPSDDRRQTRRRTDRR